MMKDAQIFILTVLLIFLTTGCASFGPAPAKLSAGVGDRIAEMQGLHQLTLDSFFKGERKRVDDFMKDTWIPLFLKNFLGNSGLMHELEKVSKVGEYQRDQISIALKEYVGEDNANEVTIKVVDAITQVRIPEENELRNILGEYEIDQIDIAVSHIISLLNAPDPGFLILEWAQDAQTVINEQRLDLMKPIDEAEREITAELAHSYAEILKANGVITARLEAASKTKETQDQLLNLFNISQPSGLLSNKLSEISGKVGDVLTTAESLISDSSNKNNNEPPSN